MKAAEQQIGPTEPPPPPPPDRAWLEALAVAGEMANRSGLRSDAARFEAAADPAKVAQLARYVLAMGEPPG